MSSEALRGKIARAFEALQERAPVVIACLDQSGADLRFVAEQVLARSDFVLRCLLGDPPALPELLSSGALDGPRSAKDYARLTGQIQQQHARSPQEIQPTMRSLRRLRQREMLRIAWRDLAGFATLEQTLAETSAFATACIALASEVAQETLALRFGLPRAADGSAQPLIVLGMGKLGGGELNFSSDVDLVLLFPNGGDTDGPQSISNEEFYTRQGRELIKLLDAQTEDGFVFRVDMRLRPFGDSGPLVASFASFEDYLQMHGRDWERYAYVKARALTGTSAFVEAYRSALRPFVYRRYLDFGVFESLREMKRLIEREVVRRELADDVKLGPGGIREIEFVVQAFQLIRGGQDSTLREQSLLTVLPRLQGAKLLPPHAVTELSAAYRFLRRLENRLQMLDDRQTHRLPQDELECERIALAMDLPDFATLREQLQIHRDRVQLHFQNVVLATSEANADPDTASDELGPLWDEGPDSGADLRLVAQLRAAGHTEPAEMQRLLTELRDSTRTRRLDVIGRRRLASLLQRVLQELPRDVNSLPVLRRLLGIIEAIGARSAYFALLLENAAALRRLIHICAHGTFLATQIARHPLLLDELLDERVLEQLPDRAGLARDLQLRIEALASREEQDDTERYVETLCHFKQAALFHIAVADLGGRLPLMRVSDRLTEVAELILEQSMSFALHQMSAQLGAPHCGVGAERRAVRLIAIGYGKLGGRELGYSSDLDLVFLHDSRGELQETEPPPASERGALDNQVFFLRFAQRLVHLLTMHSAAGRLYEVDVRLRPSGKGGMLVTSIDAFHEYQRGEAWTWEHQALLHARAVAGDPTLIGGFEALRLEVLRQDVRRPTLRDEVRDMRERMRRELSSAAAGQFDIKQDRGGVADIEFLAQFWALRWADEQPPVAWFSDTIRQLESVASANLVPQERVDELVGAYQAYRARTHHLSLEDKPGVVSATEFTAERAAVTAIWNATMAPGL
ncbi:MAG: bifunctional [glutamate--ammonia ligase]-adenylyl-L-tyrosine phosphorylase/[glutamate--ammonia-ligase] adenylyltransferase [Steroidobacteraceae bacterium]